MGEFTWSSTIVPCFQSLRTRIVLRERYCYQLGRRRMMWQLFSLFYCFIVLLFKFFYFLFLYVMLGQHSWLYFFPTLREKTVRKNQMNLLQFSLFKFSIFFSLSHTLCTQCSSFSIISDLIKSLFHHNSSVNCLYSPVAHIKRKRISSIRKEITGIHFRGRIWIRHWWIFWARWYGYISICQGRRRNNKQTNQ